MNDLSPREQAIVALALGRSPLDVARELDVPEAAVRRVGGLLGWPGDTRQLKRAASAIHAGERLWVGELAERPGDVVPVGQAQPAPEATADEPDDVLCLDCGAAESDCQAPIARACCQTCTHPLPWADPAPITDQGDPMPKPCAHAAHHIAIGPDEVVGAGDRLTIDGLRGTAIHCPGCWFSALVLDPDDEQPSPAPTPDEAAEALAVLGDVEQLTSPPGLEPADPARATLVMPLVHLVDDVDGTRTLVAQAVVEVRILPDGLIGYLGGDGNAGVVDYDVTRQLTLDGAAAIRTLAALLPPVRDAEAPPWGQ